MNSPLKMILVAGVLLLLLGGVLFRSKSAKLERALVADSAIDVDPIKLEEVRKQVISFCGNCHATPRPDSFPRDAWVHEVDRGYEFYYESGRSDLEVPIKRDVYDFYRSQAPVSLVLPTRSSTGLGKLRFRQEKVVFPDIAGNQTSPALAHLKWITAGRYRSLPEPLLLTCDMQNQQYQEIRFPSVRPEFGRSATPGHLAHVEATDLDSDGEMDFVLADLGSFLPQDHDRGRVLWLKAKPDGTLLEPVELATGLGRVADVRPGDFDGDGDVDLVVAEFGWLKTGRILQLENIATEKNPPEFKLSVLDQRHGTIHTPVVDLNGDGHLDFVAVISQEHEVVEAFLNDGAGGFSRELIFTAEDPSYGTSGIELVDLDQDGDVDVLYTNGDMYDSFRIKPYHAVHWFENAGNSIWRDHELMNMPGVMRALPGDLDHDGDLDIVAVALIPDRILLEDNIRHGFDSIVWLEQVTPGQFAGRALETGMTHHASLEVADFDQDGDTDLAVGDFQEGTQQALTIWWNETPALTSDN